MAEISAIAIHVVFCTVIIDEDDDAIKVASTTSELTCTCVCTAHGLTVW